MKPRSAHFLNDNNHILLSSQHTMFVIVDHQIAFRPCFDADLVDAAEMGVTELVDAASKTGIPIVISLVKNNLIDSELSTTLEPKTSQLTRLNRNVFNPWDDPAFAEAVQFANRPCMLIAGLSAETSMSFTALGGLARGLDVFVVKDACLGYSEQSIDISFDRLIQAGVVPVSWRQALLEWQHKSVDVGLLRRVLKSRRLPKS